MTVRLAIIIGCDDCGVASYEVGAPVYEITATAARAAGWLDDGPFDWWCPACQDVAEEAADRPRYGEVAPCRCETASHGGVMSERCGTDHPYGAARRLTHWVRAISSGVCQPCADAISGSFPAEVERLAGA